MTMRSRLSGQRGEEGAVLVLVLLFVMGVGLALAALVSLAGSNLSASLQIQSERNIEYSADAVMEGAIQTVRTVPPSSTENPACPTFPSSGTGLVINQNTQGIVVYCFMGAFSTGRVVQFAACYSTNTTYATCTTKALILAEVEYSDTGCTGIDQGCSPYGATVTIESWVVQRANE